MGKSKPYKENSESPKNKMIDIIDDFKNSLISKFKREDNKTNIKNTKNDKNNKNKGKNKNSNVHTEVGFFDKIKNIDFKNKNLQKGLAGVSLAVVLGLSINHYNNKTKALDMYLGEDKVGTVRSEEDANEVLDSLKDELSKTYNLKVVLQNEVKLEPSRAKDKDLTSDSLLKSNLKSKMNFLVQGYTLEVDGEKVGVVGDGKDIELALEEIEQPYKELKEGEIKKDVAILENINIVKEEVPLFEIGTKEQLVTTLQSGSEEIKKHTVEVGESLWTIAKIYNTSVDELVAANSDKNPERLQIGDEVKLVMPKAMLTVATTSEIEYTEKINYEQEVELNDSMFTNEKTVKVAGENGVSKIAAKEVKHNGVVIETEVLKQEVIKAPVNELVVKGTKEVPKTAATGAFMMPTRGRISSPYGMRNGRMHRGLDIATKIGTPIKAADGGTVVYSGYSGAFGNMIEIDHGNGYKTRYAHCSKLIVGNGAKVYKGQHIANVGNTGRSTGPHLHLEVLKNGSNQNPSKYVN